MKVLPALALCIILGCGATSSLYAQQAYGETNRAGLFGKYYYGDVSAGKGSFVYSRVDEQINFAWGGGVMPDGMTYEEFGRHGLGNPESGMSIEWTGNVRIPQPGVYTFAVEVEWSAFVRVYINGQNVIDVWEEGPGGTRSSTWEARLTQAELPIRIVLYRPNINYTNACLIRLKWRTPFSNETSVLIERKYLIPAAHPLDAIIADFDTTLNRLAPSLSANERDALEALLKRLQAYRQTH